MTFYVPEAHAGLFDEVTCRFRLLLLKSVVTGISNLTFNNWLTNFTTSEDKYLSARLLENLTFRSEAMVGSAIKHILECILPAELRRVGIYKKCVDDFVDGVTSGKISDLLRFVPVEDPKNLQPGKSGQVLIREMHRLGDVNNSLFCFAKDIARLPASVACIVFIDDMVGTGTQFTNFAKAHGLEALAKDRCLVYCPLAAHKNGLNFLATNCGWLRVCPVEEFDEQHNFFRGMTATPNIWAIDGSNTTVDVKAHMQGLCGRAGFSVGGRFALDLLIGFHHATPNNTLRVMYEQSPTWNRLLIR